MTKIIDRKSFFRQRQIDQNAIFAQEALRKARLSQEDKAMLAELFMRLTATTEELDAIEQRELDELKFAFMSRLLQKGNSYLVKLPEAQGLYHTLKAVISLSEDLRQPIIVEIPVIYSQGIELTPFQAIISPNLLDSSEIRAAYREHEKVECIRFINTDPRGYKDRRLIPYF